MGNRGWGVALLALTAAIFLLFLPVVTGVESFFGRDVTPYFYPMKHFLAETIRSGRLPLWNPLVAGGEPFFATLQPGVFYPGSLLVYALPFPSSVDWLLVVHFWFAGAGWILLLRTEGRTVPAATFGALALVLGGFFVSLGNFINNLQTMSWAPWLFLAWGAYLRYGTTPRLLIFVATCAAAFLGGEPQLLALVLAVVFARGILRPSGSLSRTAHELAAFAAAGVLTLFLTGFQLVPFVEFIGESVRTFQLDLSFSASRSQEPIGLLHLIVPSALHAGEHGFTTGYLASTEIPWLLSLYPGVVVTGFVGFGLMAARRSERVFWAILAAFGLLLALGSHTIVYRGAFELIPPLRAFRYPEKFAVLFALAVPFLAAAGFERWQNGVDSVRLAWWFAFGAVTYGALSVIVAAGSSELANHCSGSTILLCDDPIGAARMYALTAGRLAAILAIAAVVVFMRDRSRLRPVVALWLLLGIAALDLLVAHRSVNPSVDSEVYTDRPWALEALQDDYARRTEYRFRATPVGASMGQSVRVRGAAELSNLYLSLQSLGPNAGQTFGVLQQDGLQGVELKTVAMTNDAATRAWARDPVRFLRSMNVRYYGDATPGADSMAGLRELSRHSELPIRLYEVPDPLPRAFVADGWETAEGPGAALHRALQADVPIRRVVLEDTPAQASAARSGRIVAATWEAERVRLIARTDEPAIVVLLDRWYPGWTARVNGQPVDVLRANGAFRAVEVPAGYSDIEFIYRPTSLVIGIGLTAIGLIACFGLWWWPRRRRGQVVGT